jgi:four helix bundle protein
MVEKVRCYKDLIVWQKSVLLVEQVYKLTKTFPHEELYGIVSQMRRAAVSIPANIAEGQGRNSRKEFAYFLSISRGSLAELETLIVLSNRMKYISEAALKDIVQQCDETGRLLTGLHRSLVMNRN